MDNKKRTNLSSDRRNLFTEQIPHPLPFVAHWLRVRVHSVSVWGRRHTVKQIALC